MTHNTPNTMNKGHIQAERAEAIRKAMNTGTQSNVENVNRYAPMLIADGLRGVYARSHAARELGRLIDAGYVRFSGHTVQRGDMDIAADMTDEDSNEAWETVANGVYSYGERPTEYRIYENEQGIFLVPQGCDMEQD